MLNAAEFSRELFPDFGKIEGIFGVCKELIFNALEKCKFWDQLFFKKNSQFSNF